MYSIRIEVEGCDVLEIDNITIIGHVLNDRLDPRDEKWSPTNTVNIYNDLQGVWCYEQRQGVISPGKSEYGYTLVIGAECVKVKAPHTNVQFVSEQRGTTVIYYVLIPSHIKHSITLNYQTKS